MALPLIWSRRKRLREKEASGAADLYTYNSLPHNLRYQTIQIIRETALQMYGNLNFNQYYERIVPIIRKELGVPALARGNWVVEEFETWFLNEPSVDNLLDSIEIGFALFEHRAESTYGADLKATVDELNARMLEAGFGFQLDNGQIIQISDQFVHSEVTLPVLGLLSDPAFAAANQEFRQAHAEFRDGDYEDSIHDCCNAFESVLKVILTKKGWTFDPNATASKLLGVAFDNQLIPTYLQNEFTGLRTILESGVPTVRNKTAGHGAGTSTRNIPKYFAAFQLHQTAAAILLLVEAAK